jgi:hypothetical protein
MSAVLFNRDDHKRRIGGFCYLLLYWLSLTRLQQIAAD